MKKISIFCTAVLMALCAYAEKGAIILQSPAQMQVTAVSPNGKWACGIIGDGVYTTPQAALWNLESGEVKYLSNEESYAQDVNDDGIVVGSFTDYTLSGNGAGIVVAGSYHNGKWTAFVNDCEGFTSQPGGEVYSISADGRRAVGNVVSSTGKYVPAMWEDGKLLKTLPVKHEQGRAYAISEDGTMATGWAYDKDARGSLNRTVALWRGDSIQNLSAQSSAWEAGISFSLDGTKIICNAMGKKFMYDLTTNEKTEIPWLHPACWSQEMSYVGNDGLVMGGESYQDMNTGASDMYGYVFDGTNAMRLDDWLRDNHNVDIPAREFIISRGITMDRERKVIAILGYDLVNGNGDHSSRIILLDREVEYCEPVALNAEKLIGVNSVRLTWKAPLANAGNVLGYNVYRNGEIIVEATPENSCVDVVDAFGTYTYTVTALYENGDDLQESAHSIAAVIDVTADIPNSVQHIETNPVNYNDLRLRWAAPESNLPSASYYDASAPFSAFGGGFVSFSVAIKLPYDIVNNYAGNYALSRVAFMPMNSEGIYTIKVFVDGDEKISQKVDGTNLIYGEMNMVDLNNPIEIEQEQTIMIAVDVDASKFTVSSNNVMGMSYGVSVPGYSDLVRQMNEPEYYSLNESAVNSGLGEMLVSWAISGIFCTLDENGKPQLGADEVVGYDLYRNDSKLATVVETEYLDENIAEGEYTYGIVAKYANGGESEAETIDIDFTAKEEALQPINDVVINAEPTFVEATWQAPLKNDLTVISYAKGANSGKGITLSGATDLIEYTVAHEYSPDYVKWYQGYTIESMRFYPTAEATFAMALEVNGTDVDFIVLGAMGEEGGYTLNTWNTVELTSPVVIEAGKTYRVKLYCTDVDPSTNPICTDTGTGVPMVSDLYSWDYSSFSSAFSDGSVKGSWMIGMVVVNDSEEPMPVAGYNVYIDGEQANTALIEANTYKHEGSYTEGKTHRMKVNAVYNITGGTLEVDGAMQFFTISASGVEGIEVDRVRIYPNPATSYITVEGASEKLVLIDMNGRAVAETTDSVLDVTSLPVGNYLLNVYRNATVETVKVIIVR